MHSRNGRSSAADTGRPALLSAMLRRKDGLREKVYRYRGVLAVLAIPLLVVAMFLFMVPR
jgi:hypothetical protein